MNTLTIKLKQHTPLIHFQHDQEDATLRASEVKPKLDKYIITQLGEGDYEKEMKDDAFEREKEWYFIKRTEKPLKIEEDLKKCQDKLEEFQKKEKEINEGTASLKKDKEQFEKKVLETKIKVYEEILKTINK